jgi:hypothetical protein
MERLLAKPLLPKQSRDREGAVADGSIRFIDNRSLAVAALCQAFRLCERVIRFVDNRSITVAARWRRVRRSVTVRSIP